MRRRTSTEDGFASLAAAGLTGLVVVTTIGVALVGAVLETVHRAGAAADLAALAGAQAQQRWSDPCAAAAEVAAANAARVVRCAVDGQIVSVQVASPVAPVVGIRVVPEVQRRARAGPRSAMTGVA